MSDECIVKEETLTDMADAIREGFNITDKMTADVMPNYIRLLGAPSYVKTEAERVIAQVKSHQNANTFTFLAISDAHYLATNKYIVESVLHAGQGLYYVRQGLDIDFVVNLGDNAWGSGIAGSETTIPVGINEIKTVNKNIALAYQNIPNFRTPGNHDNLAYNYAFNGNDYLDADEIFEFFGAYNVGCTFQTGQENRGYCYRDFEELKLRVIVMNTCDIKDLNPANGESMYTSGTQMKWFSETIDLSGKSDASNWSFIVFSHHPLDFGISINCNKILKAYLEGTSVSLTRDGVSINYNYANKNSASFIGNIHGHNHNFLKDNLRYLVSGSTTAPIKAYRMCVPNACYSRNNERGQNGTTDVFDIEFGEETTYNKVANSAKDTAFCVVTIDPVEKMVYSDHYGAGYSQSWTYADMPEVVYSITSNFTNVKSDNSNTTVTHGKSYTATLTPTKGAGINATVTMGGVDVTSTVYNNGAINIPSVTGDIVITATAITGNLIPYMTTTYGGKEIYNGKGYKENTRMNSNLEAVDYDGMCLTGYIPVKAGDVVRIKNITINGTATSYWVRHSIYNTDVLIDINTLGNPDEKGVYTVTIDQYTLGFRLSVGNVDATSIITVNEEIAVSSYTVTNNLTNVTSNNASTNVFDGSSYTAILTPKNTYNLSTVKVTMGGTDITSNVYANGMINIPKVTGDIVITATATEPNYTNLVPTAEDAAGTGIYNGVGYKNGIYLSSSGGTSYDSSDANYTATGWIPYKVKSDGTFPSIYIKGLDWVEESHSRLFFYYLNNGVKNIIYGVNSNLLIVGSNTNIANMFTVTDLGDKYWKLTPTSTMNGMDTAISTPITWLRLSLKGKGENLIVTIDEPIE